MKNKIMSVIALTILLILQLASVSHAYTKEIAKTTSHYSHPVTGAIEDSGNNKGIGQGMTENVLTPQALVETMDDGKIFLTVRYNLASYLKNESFAVQNYGDEGFYKVSAEITKENEDTRDYRFEIPSKNVVVRTSCFVEPMGRDVIFYFTISDFAFGNTDFVTNENSSSSITNSEINVIKETSNMEKQTISAKNELLEENNQTNDNMINYQENHEKIEENPVNNKLSTSEIGYSTGLLTKDSEIIKKIFYSDENEQEKTKEETKLGNITLAFIYALIALLVIVTASNMLLMTLSFFYKNKIEEKLDKKRSELYEKN